MKKIIAAVDFSNATPAVIEIAAKLAKSFGADLQLFHVIEPAAGYAAYGFSSVDYPPLYDFQEEEKRRATLKLEKLLAAVQADLPGATSCLSAGSPLHELLAQVKQSGADFVVLGAHGHGVISAMLLGSVAEGMVRKATVPTLVIPAPSE